MKLMPPTKPVTRPASTTVAIVSNLTIKPTTTIATPINLISIKKFPPFIKKIIALIKKNENVF